MNSFSRIFAVLLLISLTVVVVFTVFGSLPSSVSLPHRSEFTASGEEETSIAAGETTTKNSDLQVQTETAATTTSSPSPPPPQISSSSTLSFSHGFINLNFPSDISRITSFCASLLLHSNKKDPAFIINSKTGVRFIPSAGTNAVQIATCPIDKATPGYRRLHATTKNFISSSSSSSSKICKSTIDVALVGDLFRPQHTMQFLFSLMGVVALQSELNLYEAQVPVFVNVMRYADIGSAKDFCRKKNAHFELLDLLGPVRDENASPMIYLFRDAEWKQYTIQAPPLSLQISGKYPIASTCFTPTQEKLLQLTDDVEGVVITTTEQKTSPKNDDEDSIAASLNDEDNVCVKRIVWGSIPVRIPGQRIKTDANLKPKYFQDFRSRIIQRWLKPQNNNNNNNSPSYSGHILLVRRRKENGRFLHQDLKMAQIVKESLEFLDSSSQNDNNDENDSSSSSPKKSSSSPTKIEIVPVEWENMKIRDQLRLVVNARAMIGVHGNGLTWACFMREGSFILEFSSSIHKRNEVFEGINIANAGNIAPACGMKSLSLRAPWVESEKTGKDAPPFRPHHKWKLVDIEPGEREFKAVETFVKSNGTKYT